MQCLGEPLLYFHTNYRLMKFPIVLLPFILDIGFCDKNDSKQATRLDSDTVVNLFVGSFNDSRRYFVDAEAEAGPEPEIAQDDDEGDAQKTDETTFGKEPKTKNFNSTQVYIIGIIGVAPAALGAFCYWLSKIRKKCTRPKKNSYQTPPTRVVTLDMKNGPNEGKQLRKFRYFGSSSDFLESSDLSLAENNNLNEIESQTYTSSFVRKRRVYSVEYPRKELELLEVLGEGNFGQVWKAKVSNLLKPNCGDSSFVAVKTNKADSEEKDHIDLLQELDVMLQLSKHPNVVRIFGCCTETVPYFIIMEYVENGKLLSYLRRIRGNNEYYNDFSDDKISVLLLQFVYQIAKGMEFISSHGIIHRDLAARNVLVSKDKVCKIADFGLARSIREKEVDAYEQKTRGALPIRWMAPESLFMTLFTPKSDVWSLGILIWEIVTLGSTPYPGMSAQDVVKKLKEGYRMEKPTHCDPDFYQLMRSTWLTDPIQRPSFIEIKERVAQMLHQQKGYVDLVDFQQNLYYNVLYNSPGEKV